MKPAQKGSNLRAISAVRFTGLKLKTFPDLRALYIVCTYVLRGYLIQELFNNVF